MNPLFPEVIHCGKQTYPDKKAAVSQINFIMRKRGRNRPSHLRPYPCGKCRGWHISSS